MRAPPQAPYAYRVEDDGGTVTAFGWDPATEALNFPTVQGLTRGRERTVTLPCRAPGPSPCSGEGLTVPFTDEGDATSAATP